ncbi:MAG: hypothetical protein DRQ47_03540, partial [Gammaproteobacteria bacterium]
MNFNIKAIIPTLLLVFIVWLGMNSYTTVPPGHNKVATLFGDVQEEAIREGFHIVNPLLKFYTYDLRV